MKETCNLVSRGRFGSKCSQERVNLGQGTAVHAAPEGQKDNTALWPRKQEFVQWGAAFGESCLQLEGRA